MRPTLTKLVFLALVMAPAGCKPPCLCIDAAGDPALSLGDGGWPGTSFTAMGDPRSGNWAIDFGQVSVGAQANATAVLGNTGVAVLQILDVSPPTDAEFSLTLSAGTLVEPGGEVAVPVAFRPFNTGPKTGTVVISTDSAQTHVITLNFSGTGVN